MSAGFDLVAHGRAMRQQGWWQDKTPDDLLERAIARDPEKKAVVAYRMDRGFDALPAALVGGGEKLGKLNVHLAHP